MQNRRLIRLKSLKHVCTMIHATRIDSSETSSPRIKRVTIHLKCDTITDNWVSDRQTRHRLPPSVMQSRTTKTTYPVVEKGAANLAAFKNAIKKLNSWLSPDGNPNLLLTKDIKTDMLHNTQSFRPLKSIIELHLFYKVVINQDEIILVNDAIDWVMQRSLEESGPGMVPASDSSIKSLRRTIIVDGDDDDDGGCESCSICFEDFSAGSDVSCLPCSHVYHLDCIGKWLTTSHYCPNCRYEMPTN